MGLVTLRGAVGVEENSRQAILTATKDLLISLRDKNGLVPENVVTSVFSATRDLDAAYPAEAARSLGWTEAALLCVQEMAVRGAMERVIRVLIQANLDLPQSQVSHVYLGRAASLRPDLTEEGRG